MQQTETYNLNLIETSDPFSPAPLNENAEKTEAAVLAEAAARAAETQVRAAAVAALDSRVTVLEGHKVRMAVGTYSGGNSNKRTIPLPFTPKAVIVARTRAFTAWICTCESPFYVNGVETLKCVENGFWVNGESHAVINFSEACNYIAFG